MSQQSIAEKVFILRTAYEEIQAECLRFESVETGTVLIGKQVPNGYMVTKALLPGPNARRTPASFSPDVEYVQKELDAYRADRPEEDFLGIHHQHPSWLPRPSGGDLHQAREMLVDPDYKIGGRLLSIISTRNGVSIHLYPFQITANDHQFTPLKMEILKDENRRNTHSLTRPSILIPQINHPISGGSIWDNPDFQWHQTSMGQKRLEEEFQSIRQVTGIFPKTLKTPDGVLVMRIKRLLIVFPPEYPFNPPRFFRERRGGKLEEMMVLPQLVSWNSSRSLIDLLSIRAYRPQLRDSLVRSLFITPIKTIIAGMSGIIGVLRQRDGNNQQNQSEEETPDDQQSQHKRECYRENQNDRSSLQ